MLVLKDMTSCQFTVQERGLLSQFPLFCYILNFSVSPKYMLVIEYHVLFWQKLTEKFMNRTLVTHTPGLCDIFVNSEPHRPVFQGFSNITYHTEMQRFFLQAQNSTFCNFWKGMPSWSLLNVKCQNSISYFENPWNCLTTVWLFCSNFTSYQIWFTWCHIC